MLNSVMSALDGFRNKAQLVEAKTYTRLVYEAFKAILEDRVPPKHEVFIDGYAGFLFTDKAGLPLVAMHWEHRFNSMVNRYN